MILVVLSTHVELASATARGHSYCEMGELKKKTFLFNFRFNIIVKERMEYEKGTDMHEREKKTIQNLN